MSAAALRHNRDYVRLQAGRSLSAFGTQASFVCVPVLVLSVTRDPSLVGLIASTEAAAALAVFPFAGLLADRCGHRRVMLASSLLGGAAMMLLTVAVLTRHAPVTVITAAMVVVSASGVSFPAAAAGLVREIVPGEDLTTAMSVSQARAAVAGIAGPVAGAGLYAVSHALPFAVDTFSYLACLGCVAFIHRPRPARARRGPVSAGPLHDITAGLTLALRDRFLRYLLVLAAIVDFAFSGVIILLVTTYGADGTARANSVILATAACANLLGAALAPAAVRRWPERTIFLITLWAAAVLVAAMAVAHGVGWAALLVGGCCVATPAVAIIAQTASLRTVPEHLVGRVQVVYLVVPQVLASAGPLAAGLMERVLPEGAILLLFAAPIVGCALYTAFAPAVRDRAPRRPSPQGHSARIPALSTSMIRCAWLRAPTFRRTRRR